tara:strand:- start:211 stop:414 length:204 start_codon:yes stop_codon:yes gene_type:complete
LDGIRGDELEYKAVEVGIQVLIQSKIKMGAVMVAEIIPMFIIQPQMVLVLLFIVASLSMATVRLKLI